MGLCLLIQFRVGMAWRSAFHGARGQHTLMPIKKQFGRGAEDRAGFSRTGIQHARVALRLRAMQGMEARTQIPMKWAL